MQVIACYSNASVCTQSSMLTPFFKKLVDDNMQSLCYLYSLEQYKLKKKNDRFTFQSYI